jgi:hypothetical protein
MLLRCHVGGYQRGLNYKADAEGKRSMFLINISILLQDYAVLHLRGPQSEHHLRDILKTHIVKEGRSYVLGHQWDELDTETFKYQKMGN